MQGPSRSPAAAEAFRAPSVDLEPFQQPIPGGAFSIAMRPVAGGAVTVPGAEPVKVAPFWIAATETTWEAYDVFVFALDDPKGNDADAITRPSRPYVPPDRGYGHRGYAAISVAYRGAEAFCTWLSAKTGRRYRLPTEAEWLCACAESAIMPESADAHSWHRANAGGTPHPVATKGADALGLFDLWGNVREWATAYEGRPVALGGSFRDAPDAIGCTGRALPTPEWQVTDPQVPKSSWWLSDADFMGFRIVCEP